MCEQNFHISDKKIDVYHIYIHQIDIYWSENEKNRQWKKVEGWNVISQIRVETIKVPMYQWVTKLKFVRYKFVKFVHY